MLPTYYLHPTNDRYNSPLVCSSFSCRENFECLYFPRTCKAEHGSYTYNIALGRWGKPFSRSLHWGLQKTGCENIFHSHENRLYSCPFEAAALSDPHGVAFWSVEFGRVTKNGCFVTFFHVNRSGTTDPGMGGFKLEPGRGSYGNFSGCWGFFWFGFIRSYGLESELISFYLFWGLLGVSKKLRYFLGWNWNLFWWTWMLFTCLYGVVIWVKLYIHLTSLKFFLHDFPSIYGVLISQFEWNTFSRGESNLTLLNNRKTFSSISNKTSSQLTSFIPSNDDWQNIDTLVQNFRYLPRPIQCYTLK